MQQITTKDNHALAQIKEIINIPKFPRGEQCLPQTIAYLVFCFKVTSMDYIKVSGLGFVIAWWSFYRKSSIGIVIDAI